MELKDYTEEQLSSELNTRKVGNESSKNGSYPMKCSECGKDSTVPFKPKNNWPLYCYDCYKKRKQ